MPVLPIPMIVALLLATYLLKAILGGASRMSLLLLLAACAGQSAILALVQYYGFHDLRVIQPVTATLIPPLAWLAFIDATQNKISPMQYVRHAWGPAFTLFCTVFARDTLDVIISLLFAGYGIAILLKLRRGEDSLPHSRLDSGSKPLFVWRIMAVSLLGSAIGDLVISIVLMQGFQFAMPLVATLLSSFSLLTLGALSLSDAIENRLGNDPDEIISDLVIDEAKDAELMLRLDELMAKQKPYLDPELTLTRLSRKLIVPAKQLSACINRTKNENVSRYINRFRVEHSCELMKQKTLITSAMLESGFNTKSNFNREFLRIIGQPPSKWQDKQVALLQDVEKSPYM